MAQSNYSFLSKFKRHVNSSMVLIFFTVLALICANLPVVKDWYFGLWQNEVMFSVGNFNLFSHNGHAMNLGAVINDFLMAIFFLSVGLEIKREIRVGELSTKEKALLPIIGACGGMLVPVLLFALVCPGDAAMQRGLAIPMATDIAFSLGVLAVFKTRVPVGLKVFLAALAVADDLGGIIVIALFYSSNISWLYLGLCAACVAVMIIANIAKVRAKSFYLIVGLVLWYMMLNSGIHATISGVIVALCIPATLKKGTGHYLERIRKQINKFPVIDVDDLHKTVVLTNNEVHILKSIESAADKMISPLQDLEDNLHGVINFFVIPLFAFANAGIDMSMVPLNFEFCDELKELVEGGEVPMSRIDDAVSIVLALKNTILAYDIKTKLAAISFFHLLIASSFSSTTSHTLGSLVSIIFLADLILLAISLVTKPLITCGLNNSSAISLGIPH